MTNYLTIFLRFIQIIAQKSVVLNFKSINPEVGRVDWALGLKVFILGSTRCAP